MKITCPRFDTAVQDSNAGFPSQESEPLCVNIFKIRDWILPADR